MPTNDFGQPIGPPLPDWTPRPHPPRTIMVGRLCRLEPLTLQRHGSDLYDTIAASPDNRRWTYLPYGPFAAADTYREWIATSARSEDPLFHAIVGPDGRAVGVAAYMRIDPANGVIEVGHLNFSSALQRTAAATEAMYLMMRRAAVRLGFTHEGLFRHALVYRHRSRDTAWFSITDAEWPDRRAAFDAWLSPENFDAAGAQRRPLSAFMPGRVSAYDRVSPDGGSP